MLGKTNSPVRQKSNQDIDSVCGLRYLSSQVSYVSYVILIDLTLRIFMNSKRPNSPMAELAVIPSTECLLAGSSDLKQYLVMERGKVRPRYCNGGSGE